MVEEEGTCVTMEVEQWCEQIQVPVVLHSLLNDFSAVTDYRTLRDSLPRRLATALQCRCVLLYLRVGETLQLASGSFNDVPGWSAALLAVAHVNPVDIQGGEPEACAWRERCVIQRPETAEPTLLAVPLLYRQRAIGVLVLLRGHDEADVPREDMAHFPHCWAADSATIVNAVADVVALLLENTRLLERDRERIHELSLLNSISSQMNSSIFEIERLRNVVLQRTREISSADLCELLEPTTDLTTISWITPRLRSLLFQRFREQRALTPIIIERPGDGKHAYVNDYFAELPARINTFFALPLLSSQPLAKPALETLDWAVLDDIKNIPPSHLFGCVVGGYYRPWKMRRSESALLQVVVSQASAVLENIHLVEEVVQARNEARKLLRQVLDDQRLHELILESVPSGLIATDQSGRIHTFNRAAAIILGYHPYEVLGQQLKRILNLRTARTSTARSVEVEPTTMAQQEGFLAGMHIGEVQSETLLTVDRYERKLVLEVDMRPLYDDTGTQMGLLTTFIDVTAMHRLEEEKRRLDRLASLGEMAASVAHEVRNPLASIKTSMQMLHDDLLGEDALALNRSQQREWILESVGVVRKEVERLDTIVRDLLLFAKPHQLHRVRCDIVELCEQVLALVQNQCTDANVAIHRIFDEMPPIWVDTGQIEQVLLNLYLNALQAMPDGGILTVHGHCISTEQAIYDTADSDCPPTQKPSGASGTAVSAYSWLIDKQVMHKEFRVPQWVEIIVRDTGIGMSPDQLEHIFQPFYTTKAHGIGLGLAISRRLIEDHGGYLRIESQYGYGATVAIRMPFVADTGGSEDN
ncbi:ATP-binding protein [Dictyobacter arantiisoli]|uniref:histidine kinase n=1 Tax=Dictyobacter arantiisoli TaxID=2014874 RepID=A0A5A5T9Q1_9CHLR|nr:ATP-binding protein [Dictyobacter arantiisoli]GCF07985.1 hypothetical protein KDI_15490 [Dictyobacter arantiisoli]